MNSWSILSLILVVAIVGISVLFQINLQEYNAFYIASQGGKVVIVTGANSGLGYYTALSLAQAGATVILGCRNMDKCHAAKSDILKISPTAKLEPITLDIASFKSIRTFVDKFQHKYTQVDILINNAGIAAAPLRVLSEDGLESQMATNHFGHFLLTALLFASIAPNGRIINHSSLAYLSSLKNFTWDLNSERAYDPMIVYGNTKLANILFTFELNKRLASADRKISKGIISVVTHPGYTSTNILTHLKTPNAADGFSSQVIAYALFVGEYLCAMSGPVGAQSQITGRNVLF